MVQMPPPPPGGSFPLAPGLPANHAYRVLAAVIDALILGIPLGIILAILPLPGFLEALIQMAVAVAYGTFFEGGKHQATPGKLIMGISVVGPSGGMMSQQEALYRNLAKLVSAIALLIGYIMIFFDPQHRGLHDRFAGSLVRQISDKIDVQRVRELL